MAQFGFKSTATDEWDHMVLTQRIEANEVRRLVLNWPDGCCVEVRACRGCGESTAARVRA